MKKIITAAALLAITTVFSQAFDGQGDKKFSIAANIQNGGQGLNLISDTGISDYVSMGFNFGLIVNSPGDEDAKDSNGYSIEKSKLFLEKLDFNYRVNGHFGRLIGMSEISDVYGGLNIGFRNLGIQAGYRYFITEGFGFFGEAVVPVVKFDLFEKDNNSNYYKFYEQPSVNLGIVFIF